MTREEAVEVQSRALRAIRELNAIAALPLGWKTDASLQRLRRGIGASIWTIDRELLAVIYDEFPELNDLKDVDLTQFDHLFKE